MTSVPSLEARVHAGGIELNNVFLGNMLSAVVMQAKGFQEKGGRCCHCIARARLN